MAGIVSYGGYLPVYKLGKATVGWGSGVEKAVANVDEDSVTMGVAAAMDCLKGVERKGIDALFFASTTLPYAEKQTAALVATALGLRRDILTSDVTSTLRAGTIAMKMGLDVLKAGSAKQVLVVASDTRKAAPRSAVDQSIGDGAAALLLGETSVVCSVAGSHSITNEMVDVWREQADSFVRNWEDRFIVAEGYQSTVHEAVKGLLEKTRLRAKDFAKVALYGPDAKAHRAAGTALGFDANSQLQDPLFSSVGNTGAAHALVLFVGSLEQAKPGDKLLLASYGDGSDVFWLEVTGDLTKLPPRRALQRHLVHRRAIRTYEQYLKGRGLVAEEAARRIAPSPTALWRERGQNLALQGGQCRGCGYVQYPPQRVCVKCLRKDDFDPVRLAERRATLFSYSVDHITGFAGGPLVVGIVDFDGGGRMRCTMTDCQAQEMRIGMPLEMTFRKLFAAGGIHNYYWKAMPTRESIAEPRDERSR